MTDLTPSFERLGHPHAQLFASNRIAGYPMASTEQKVQRWLQAALVVISQ
jgi:hypothetical protein